MHRRIKCQSVHMRMPDKVLKIRIGLPSFKRNNSCHFMHDQEISSVFSTYKIEADGQILNSCEPPSLPLHYCKYCKGYFEGDSILHYETLDQTPPNRIIANITTITGTKL